VLAKTGITATPPAPLPQEDEKPRLPLDAEGITQDAPDEDEPRPRKKKRKRRRKAKKSAGEVPLWVWGALAGTVLLLAGIVSAVFIHAGYGLQLLAFAIVMAIILPVSIVILVISMFIASALLGGIDFGQAHIAIPKAGALLLVVNLISMIPFAGTILALFVWFVGLMGLFGLDFVEARVLVAINWGLNTVFRYVVLAAILSSMAHSGTDNDPRKNRLPPDEDVDVKRIERGDEKFVLVTNLAMASDTSPHGDSPDSAIAHASALEPRNPGRREYIPRGREPAPARRPTDRRSSTGQTSAASAYSLPLDSRPT
jgi:uncharacterized membrane protein